MNMIRFVMDAVRLVWEDFQREQRIAYYSSGGRAIPKSNKTPYG